jgi:uncharacterized protein involved in type VI secretion and phage assembly
MPNEFVDSAAQAEKPDDRRIYGVAVAQVVDICDSPRLGRVKLRLPWLPGYEPWARVASMVAGADGGAFFMPQKGEEVLVAFNHGDVREPYVVGCVWNSKDPPPKKAASDPVNKRTIRTPKGHELEFDDQDKTVTLTSVDGRRALLGPESIELTWDANKTTAITLERGKITLKVGSSSITLESDKISIRSPQVDIKGQSGATLHGGAQLTLNAAKIDIG